MSRRRVNLECPVARDSINNGLQFWSLALPDDSFRGIKARDLLGINHGTITNMAFPPTATSGWNATTRPGGWGELRLDGSNDYVDFPGTSSSAFMLTNMYTLSLWTRHTGGTSLRYIASIGRDFRRIGFQTRINGTEVESVRDTVTIVTSGANFNSGGWHHLCATFDGATQAMYFDGILVGTAAGGSLSDASPTTWKIGCDATAGTFSQGAIDDIRVFSRAISASEVLAIYNDSREGYRRSLNWLDEAVNSYQAAATTNRRRRLICSGAA